MIHASNDALVSYRERVPPWLVADYLQAFGEVVSTGSVGGAARQLYLTQPAVSQRITRLEQSIGVALFTREPGRPLRVTPAGERLLSFVDVIGKQIAAFQRDIGRSGARKGETTFAIATSPMIARHVLPVVLRSLARTMPTLHVQLLHGSHDELQDQVYRGEADIGIIVDPDPRAGLEVVPFLTDHVSLIVPPGHPLTTGRMLLERLAKCLFALPPKGTRLRTAAERWAASAGLEIRVALESSDYDVLRTYVTSGLGPAIVSDIGLAAAIASGEVVELALSGLPIERQVVMIGNARSVASAVASAVLALKDVCPLPAALHPAAGGEPRSELMSAAAGLCS